MDADFWCDRALSDADEWPGLITVNCENCDEEIEEYDWESLLDAIRGAGWAGVKNPDGTWTNYCAECAPDGRAKEAESVFK